MCPIVNIITYGCSTLVENLPRVYDRLNIADNLSKSSDWTFWDTKAAPATTAIEANIIPFKHPCPLDKRPKINLQYLSASFNDACAASSAFSFYHIKQMAKNSAISSTLLKTTTMLFS